MLKFNIFTLFVVTFFLSSDLSHAQCDSIGWSSDPSVNLNVSPWGANPHADSDGDGGVYILWNTGASLSTFQYLHWVDRCGIIRWPQPLEIRGEKNGTSYQAGLSEDGLGGVLVSFTEWHASGWNLSDWRVRVTTLEMDQFGESQVVPDGGGGAIVSFDVLPDSLYIQHISSSGQRLWGDEGILVIDTSGLNFDHLLIPDMQGGAIIQWYGYDTGFKRYDTQGNELWHTPSPFRTLYYSRMIPDGSGGAVMSGTEPAGYRSVIANRISSDGLYLWGNMGIILSDSVGLSQNAGVNSALDSNGTAAFVWTEQEGLFNIFTQKLTYNGQRLWIDNLAISSNPEERWGAQIVQSDNYGNIYVWYDFRNGSEANLYAQKIDSSGNRIWSSNDNPITLNRTTEFRIISDLRNGLIAAWSDEPLNGIFAQQVSKNGNLGEIVTGIDHKSDYNAPVDFTLFQNYPNPFNSSTIIHFQLSSANNVTLRIYNMVGEEINTLMDKEVLPGIHRIVWKGDDYSGNPVASGIYVCQLKVGRSSTVQKMVQVR